MVVVLGDQLDRGSSAWDGFDPAQDLAFMAEVAEESTVVRSAKQRTALFLAAMRHFAAALREARVPLVYRRLDDPANRGTLGAEFAALLQERRPRRVVVTEPGDWRVREMLRETAGAAGVPIEVRPDRHFFCSVDEFARHAAGRRQLRMEFFYREMRRRHGVLMDGDEPAGGRWNFDAENRATFGAGGPGPVPPTKRVAPDAVTREVLDLVERRFADHPGTLAGFGWPVTRVSALEALDDFIERRLPLFGRYQDAMWSGQPWLYHAHLSAALNLKLLDPREVVARAEAAWQEGRAPLASVEGFVRQVLGWREYVRGIYWTRMPQYAASNELGAGETLPGFYWTGQTAMRCLSETIGQTLEHGYAHHIQRLMVTGLYALLLGVEPRQVHEWYLAVYVDAVEWAELPNTIGMSQYADGGLLASKPYVATGGYIDRMSDYCRHCRFDPARATGDDACPFTTLYWDFLARHQARLASNPRMALQVRNLARRRPAERNEIAVRAERLRREGGNAE